MSKKQNQPWKTANYDLGVQAHRIVTCHDPCDLGRH